MGRLKSAVITQLFDGLKGFPGQEKKKIMKKKKEGLRASLDLSEKSRRWGRRVSEDVKGFHDFRNIEPLKLDFLKGRW